MRAFYLLFCIVFLTFNSCNTATKTECDCETDCPDKEIHIFTPENSISDEQLYLSYLLLKTDKIGEEIKANEKFAKGTLDSIERNSLVEKITVENTRLDDLNERIKQLLERGIKSPCVFCPDKEQFCCPKLVLANFITNKGDFKIKGFDSNGQIIDNVSRKNEKIITNDNVIFPVKFSENLKTLKVDMNDPDGKPISFNIRINN